MTDPPPAPAMTPDPAPAPPGMSLLGRAVAVFVRPSQAWGGLEDRSQWWFPFLVMMVVSAAWSALLFPRAIVPMVLENLEAQVASGQVPAEQLVATERIMTGPVGIAFGVGSQTVVQGVMVLITAALVLFVVSFVLGVRFRFRLALEVTSWAWLVHLPAYVATGALAWIKESMLGVHVGFGALLPEPETPSRMLYGLGNGLDALGPLSVWPVVVAILGASALSGAPRKSVAWVLGGLYLVLSILLAGLSAMNAPV